MKMTGEDLGRSVGDILARFGIDKIEAKKAREQLETRIRVNKAKKTDVESNEKYYVHFVNRFGFIDLAVDDALMPTLSLVEQVLYRRLYRLSFGYGKTWCQVSYSELRKSCNISSDMTVRKGVKGLEDKHCIKVITPSIQRKPPIYRIYLPCEMPQFSALDVQTSVIFAEDKLDTHLVRELLNSDPNFSPLKISPLKIRSLNELRQLIFNTQNPKFSGLKSSPLTNKMSSDADPEDKKNVKNTPIDNIIHNNTYTLSIEEAINVFYNSINQTKITKQKRERAENNIKELLEEGFSKEDIAFAVKWTIENSREKPYDFSLIKETIGQAMAAKEQEKAKETKKLEIEQNKVRKMEEEKKANEDREKIKSYKDKLSVEQKSELRTKALDEIHHTKGIKEEFITEILIEAKENELVAKILSIDLLETA